MRGPAAVSVLLRGAESLKGVWLVPASGQQERDYDEADDH
jgi:hypothetical protein